MEFNGFNVQEGIRLGSWFVAQFSFVFSTESIFTVTVSVEGYVQIKLN